MAGTPFSVLVKPTGAFCNLDCEYCFFISKDQVLPGDPLMSEDALEIFLRRYLDEQPDGEVSVAAFRDEADTRLTVLATKQNLHHFAGQNTPTTRDSTSTMCCRPTAPCSTTGGAACWPNTRCWSGSASTGRRTCTTGTG